MPILGANFLSRVKAESRMKNKNKNNELMMYNDKAKRNVNKHIINVTTFSSFSLYKSFLYPSLV